MNKAGQLANTRSVVHDSAGKPSIPTPPLIRVCPLPSGAIGIAGLSVWFELRLPSSGGGNNQRTVDIVEENVDVR